MRTIRLAYRFLLITICINLISLMVLGKEFGYTNPMHQQQLQEISKKTQDQLNNNLNRFAFTGLQYYDVLSDSLFKIECDDTIQSIDNSFNIKYAIKLDSLAKLKSALSKYRSDLKTSSDAFYDLLKKSVITLTVWILLIVVIIRFRRRKVKQAEKNLSLTKDSAENSNELKAIALKRSDEIRKIKEQLKSIESNAVEIKTALSILHEKNSIINTASSQINDSIVINDNITSIIQREIKTIDELENQAVSDSIEKSKYSINNLCEYYLELSFRGNCLNPDRPFNCIVTKDMEKNLPLLSVYSNDIGILLLNIFDNAFKAVRQRIEKGEKGYEPKVSVSTRILPRFIQIRVKDNGIGIQENERLKLMTKFKSSESTIDNSVNGLAIISSILIDRNKGELKIESEIGAGTDFYIKLFI